MNQRKLVGEILLRCVSEHDWGKPLDGMVDAIRHLDVDALTKAAAFHGVTGCVYRSLHSLLPPGQGATLAAQYRQSVGTHLQTLASLADLAPVLGALDSPWLVVKGPVLAEAVYPRPDLRSYNDLDVVVPAASLGQVLEAVEASGGSLLDVNWPLLSHLNVAELLLRLPGGTLLDLHWHLVNDVGPRRAFRIPMAELIERSRPVTVGRTEVMTLDATDTVLHLCVHGCLSGGNRLVWLKDVERALAHDPPDWEEIVARARAWRVTLPVALTLARARATLGAGVPEGVTEALTSDRRVWRKIASTADRVSPIDRSVGKRSIGRMVSRSTRDAAASSLRELADHIVKGMRSPLATTQDTPDMDPASVQSARCSSGTPSDRRAFLSAAIEGAAVGASPRSPRHGRRRPPL